MPANFLLSNLRQAIQYFLLERDQKLRAVSCDFFDDVSATHTQYRIGGFKPLKQNPDQLGICNDDRYRAI